MCDKGLVPGVYNELKKLNNKMIKISQKKVKILTGFSKKKIYKIETCSHKDMYTNVQFFLVVLFIIRTWLQNC